MYQSKQGKRKSSRTIFLSILLSLCLMVTLTPAAFASPAAVPVEEPLAGGNQVIGQSTVLDTLIEFLNITIEQNAGLESIRYTPEVWTPYAAALAKAKAIVASSLGTVSESDAQTVCDALITALNNLESGRRESRDFLKALIEKAEDMISKPDQYTPTFIDKLTSKLAEAKPIYQAQDSTQTQINAMAEALWEIIRGNNGSGNVDVSGSGNGGAVDIGSIAFYEGTKASIADKPWTGSLIEPAITLKQDNQTLKNGVDFTVTYKNNKNIGKATATITGIGTFVGTRTVSFKIVPKKTSVSKTVAGKKQLKVTWKKVSAKQKVSKYQVRYRVKGKSKWKTKTVSAKSGSTTLKKLAKGKTYQIQVRSYKTVKTDGKSVKYYSAWSGVKTSKKIK